MSANECVHLCVSVSMCETVWACVCEECVCEWVAICECASVSVSARVCMSVSVCCVSVAREEGGQPERALPGAALG